MQLSEEGLAYCGEKPTGELKQWNITEKNFEKKPHSKAEYDNASEEKKWQQIVSWTRGRTVFSSEGFKTILWCSRSEVTEFTSRN